jgi:S1-C subfamily serine protease
VVGDEFSPRRLGASTPLALVGACLVLGATVFSYLAYVRAHSRDAQVGALRSELRELEQRVGALGATNGRITTRLDAADRKLRAKEAGVAPLAARVLRSVFRVRTNDGWFGTGFAAWEADGQLYVVTANHVVAHAPSDAVSLDRLRGSWTGEIVGTDVRNDLALIRLDGRPPGAAPLWQAAEARTPRAGDQLLLAGSPYGLDGTVTTGIVSRVTSKTIQTDAAANPGNSGGPAVDRDGRVVGVLLAGGGENLNFAVPIARVCDRLRAC